MPAPARPWTPCHRRSPPGDPRGHGGGGKSAARLGELAGRRRRPGQAGRRRAAGPRRGGRAGQRRSGWESVPVRASESTPSTNARNYAAFVAAQGIQAVVRRLRGPTSTPCLQLSLLPHVFASLMLLPLHPAPIAGSSVPAGHQLELACCSLAWLQRICGVAIFLVTN